MKQRRSTRVALGLQLLDELFKRHILVRESAERHFPDLLQIFVKSRIAGNVRAQHESVDEETDEILDIDPVAICDRRTDDDVVLSGRQSQVLTLAARHAMPAIFPFRSWADAGGLMSYGPVAGDLGRQAGLYVGRILKGEKPAEMPVQSATKYELAVNLKTARALGLTVPTSLLGRVDEVIE